MTRIVWSWYRPADKEERNALHAAMEKRVGCELDCPDLIMEPVLAAVVGRVNGEIKHVLFVEAEAEVQSGSSEVLPPDELAEPISMLTNTLKRYNIHIVRAFVPVEMTKRKRANRASAIERLMEKIGFTEEKGMVRHFFKWIPQATKTTKVA